MRPFGSQKRISRIQKYSASSEEKGVQANVGEGGRGKGRGRRRGTGRERVSETSLSRNTRVVACLCFEGEGVGGRVYGAALNQCAGEVARGVRDSTREGLASGFDSGGAGGGSFRFSREILRVDHLLECTNKLPKQIYICLNARIRTIIDCTSKDGKHGFG